MSQENEKEAVKGLVHMILDVMDALDRGEPIEAHIRQAADSMDPARRDSVLGVLELALELHRCPNINELEPKPVPVVKEPRYRKGTGRKPVSWATCLWQPTPLAGGEA